MIDGGLQTLVLNNGNYEEFEEWTGCSYGLGTGVCGKCIAGIDSTTKAKFCVKIVRLISFTVCLLLSSCCINFSI